MPVFPEPARGGRDATFFERVLFAGGSGSMSESSSERSSVAERFFDPFP